MNGEVVCQSRALAALSCAKSLAPGPDEPAAVRPTQEGRRSPARCLQGDAQRPAEGRTADAASADPSETESGPGQRSPPRRRRPDDGPPPPQLQTCLAAAPDNPAPPSNGLPHAPLHNNNNNNNGQQRRGARAKVAAKKPTRRTAGAKNSRNRKVTDFYPIRRSSRKSKTELKCEEKKHLDDLIINGIEEGMEVQEIEGKGRGVFATRCFLKGDYVVEYHGDLLNLTDARKREAEYAADPATGCYMYYFQYLCKTYCVDATRESGRKGRLINHSKNGNCTTKLHDINGVPHLILVAARHIDKGEELLYDYGDRSKASIAAHPWLKY